MLQGPLEIGCAWNRETAVVVNCHWALCAWGSGLGPGKLSKWWWVVKGAEGGDNALHKCGPEFYSCPALNCQAHGQAESGAWVSQHEPQVCEVGRRAGKTGSRGWTGSVRNLCCLGLVMQSCPSYWLSPQSRRYPATPSWGCPWSPGITELNGGRRPDSLHSRDHEGEISHRRDQEAAGNGSKLRQSSQCPQALGLNVGKQK